VRTTSPKQLCRCG